MLAISDGLRQELAGQIRVTVVAPGFTAANVAEHVRDPVVRAQIEQSRDRFAMPPDAVARAIAYAVEQPDDVNIGEIVIRSTAHPSVGHGGRGKPPARRQRKDQRIAAA